MPKFQQVSSLSFQIKVSTFKVIIFFGANPANAPSPYSLCSAKL